MQRLFKIHAEAAPWVGEISCHINASSGQRWTNGGDILRRKLLLTAALYLSIACVSLTARQQFSLPTQLPNAQHHLPTHDPHPGPPGRRWVNAPHLRVLGLQPGSQSSVTGNTAFVCQGVGDQRLVFEMQPCVSQIMLGGGSSATVGRTPSDHVASKDKHFTFQPCHIYFACTKLFAAVVAAAA